MHIFPCIHVLHIFCCILHIYFHISVHFFVILNISVHTLHMDSFLNILSGLVSTNIWIWSSGDARGLGFDPQISL